MKTPHIHAEVIKAWADGADIEYHYLIAGLWKPAGTPTWDKSTMYRIKAEVKPDIIEMYKVTSGTGFHYLQKQDEYNLKLVFDGETGELKSAEKI